MTSTLRNDVIRILFDEYDISTPEELNEALKNLSPVDISTFCFDIDNKLELSR